MRSPLHAALSAWLAIVSVAAAPDADPPPVEHLLADLGSPEWTTREVASRRLVALGVAALEAVEARIADPDLEIATRARCIARRIIDQGPPELVAARILAVSENAWMSEAWRMLVNAKVRGESIDRRRLAAIGVVVERAKMMEELADPAPVRLGHLALGREFGQAVLREPLSRLGERALEIHRSHRAPAAHWPDLFQAAAIAGSLRGQGLEDAHIVLLSSGESHGTPVEVDTFGDEHGARVVVALVARLAGERSSGTLATSWEEAIGRAVRQESATSLARALHTRPPRDVARKRVEMLQEKCQYQALEALSQRGEGAAELALLAVALEVHESLRDAAGCLAAPAPEAALADEPGPIGAVLARLAERTDLTELERTGAHTLARHCRVLMGRQSRSIELAGAERWRRAANRHFGEERSLDALREALLLAAIRGPARKE